MKTLFAVFGLFSTISALSAGAFAGETNLDFFKNMAADPAKKHVHFMHLDGFQADIFKKLLRNGQLPHFEFLLSRAKVSFEASTVDKSETMKVIESYLTSQRNTYVTGWWEFNRNQFNFKNFWLDPAEIFNYELGLAFPVVPTIFDFLSHEGKNVTAGFSLHRRNVPFANYSRAFAEGLQAVSDHTHYKQASVSMAGVIDIYSRIAQSSTETLPAFSSSLMAPADELGHLKGVTIDDSRKVTLFNGTSGVVKMLDSTFGRGQGAQFCYSRKKTSKERVKDPYEAIFQTIDEDQAHPKQGVLFLDRSFVQQDLGEKTDSARFEKGKYLGHFSFASSKKFCIHLPEVLVYKHAVSPSAKDSIGELTFETVLPDYALGIIQVDIELGKLINTLRSVRFDCPGGAKKCFVPNVGNGIQSYAEAGKLENSLFENTLFFFSGDHGFSDSRNMMVKRSEEADSYGRTSDSLNVTFIEDLNAKLSLDTPKTDQETSPNSEIGIDNDLVPYELSHTHNMTEMKQGEASSLVHQGQNFAETFFEKIRSDVKKIQYKKYWVSYANPISNLLRNKIDQKVDQGLDPFKERGVNIMTALFLRSETKYVSAERKYHLDYYNKHVRLVYGGAARNNAELFIPKKDGDTYDWSQRPSYQDILSYRPSLLSPMTLLEAIQSNPGVGLVFIRENNAEMRDVVTTRFPLSPEMRIHVLDRMGNEGLITVIREPSFGEILFSYQILTAIDPLRYGSLGTDGAPFRTYNEWNDLSVLNQHYYHNAVAGMGGYLYSDNSSVGDISLMRSQGWNFGDNAGGHGGLHREEKLTVMIASGPGVKRGVLMGTEKYSTQDGKLVKKSRPVYPTVLDMAPTVLNWLGYPDGALADFARNGFKAQLDLWNEKQKDVFPDQAVSIVNELVTKLKPELGLDFGIYNWELHRLFKFLGKEKPDVPNLSEIKQEGNSLSL